ncbi:MAG: signal peptidase II [Opitutaceae bacterium]|nr:signal peptidase II [Opitutaceae bacterium]
MRDPSTPAPLPHRLQRLRAYRWLLTLAGGVLLLDQSSKGWISARLPLHSYGPDSAITVVPDFFYIVHVGNTGAAWSMFSGKSPFLALLAAVTLAAIYLWRHQLGLRQATAQIAFGLLTGGIAGNLVDRLAHGYVVDFLDFHFGPYTYPSFNFADASICVGVFLYLIWSVRQPVPPRAP